MSCLLLNASFEPLAVLPLRRAFLLVLKEKAEVIEEDVGELHSENRAFRIPLVIRLKHFVKIPYRARIPLNRRNVLARDRHTCQYCEGKADTMDHVHPRSRGGRHEWENVVAACRKCNHRKGDKLLSEIGMELVGKKPFTPTGTGWLILGVATKEAWMPYLQGALV